MSSRIFVIFFFISNLSLAQKRVYTVVESKMKKADTFSIYFDVRSFSLSSSSIKILDSIASNLTGKEKIDLFGFADQRGENSANLDLSKNRILSVSNFLQGKKIKDSNITSHNIGMVSSAGTIAALAKNRRVELVVHSSIPCSEVVVDEQSYSIAYPFNQIVLEDSNLNKLRGVVKILLKNRCAKLVIYTYQICRPCQKKDEKIHLDMDRVEADNTSVLRKEAIREWFISQGVMSNQLDVRFVNIACFRSMQNSFQAGTIEEYYIQQSRLDIKLVRR